MSYQWKKNGANIHGATLSTYVTPPTTRADNGSMFAVIVSNPAGRVTSNHAQLVVRPAASDEISNSAANSESAVPHAQPIGVTFDHPQK